jgi:surface antigen
MSRLMTKRSRKRLVRYSVLAANLVILLGVLAFVVRSSPAGVTSKQSLAVGSSSDTAINPVDQLSSADIAVQVARITSLYETASVTNNADSLNAQLAIGSADETVVAKPQIVATALKSRKDIHDYTTVEGDTISGLAAKFNITSDTLKWSNNYTGNDALPAGKVLTISPVSGIVYAVKAGDTPDSLASKYRANKDQIIAFNDAEVGGLVAGEQIVIPDGSIQAVAPTYTAAAASYPFGYAAMYGFNGYDFGWCTWYVANRRADIGRPVPSNLGNAYSWYILAQRSSLPTGPSPAVGAVAVNQGGNHVSVVEQVNDDGSFWVSEMNSRGQASIGDSTSAGGWGRTDWKLVPGVGNLKFIY